MANISLFIYKHLITLLLLLTLHLLAARILSKECLKITLKQHKQQCALQSGVAPSLHITKAETQSYCSEMFTATGTTGGSFVKWKAITPRCVWQFVGVLQIKGSTRCSSEISLMSGIDKQTLLCEQSFREASVDAYSESSTVVHSAPLLFWLIVPVHQAEFIFIHAVHLFLTQ